MSTVAFSRSLASEALRWRGSTPTRLPLLAAVFGLLQVVLVLATVPDPSWTQVLAYQNLWVAFVGPLTTALVVATLSSTDRAARGGATWWRPVGPTRARVSRFVVLAGLALAAHALAVAVPLALMAPLGASGGVPLGRATELVLVLWLSYLGMVAVLARAGARWGTLPVLGLGLLWAVAGTLAAETPLWVAVPFAWVVRGALPLIGTHANGVALTSDAVLAGASPWAPALLGAVLAVPVLLVPSAQRRRRQRSAAHRTERPRPPARTPRSTDPRDGETHPTPPAATGSFTRSLRALAHLLAPTPLRWMAPLAVLASVTLLRWRPATESLQAYLLLVLPLGSVVLAVVVWSTVAPGWRSVATRPSGTACPAAAMGLCALTVATAISIAVLATHAAAGLPRSAWPAVAVSTLSTGVLLTAAHLAIAVRFGLVTALAAGVVGSLLGVLVGGSGLQQTLWPVVPWAWGVCTQPYQLAVTAPMAALLTGASFLGLDRAARAAASSTS